MNYKYLALPMAVAYTLISFSDLRAQDNTSSIEVLEEINVNSTFLFEDDSFDDQKIDGLSSEQIEETLAQSIDDVLRTTPSATTSGGPRSSAEAIQVRGLTQNKLFVYIDGARQNFITDHSSMLALDTDNLKTAKVYKSTSNYKQGGSVGGGISFVTKDASDYLLGSKKVGATLKTSYQESNKENYINAKAYTKEQGNDLLISLGQRTAKDVVLGDERTLPNSSYEDTSALLKYSYASKKNEKIKLSLDHFRREDTVPMNPTLNPPKDMSDLNGTSETNRNTIGLTYELKKNRFLNLETGIYSTTQDLEKTRKSDNQKELRSIDTLGLKANNKSSFDSKYFSKIELYSGIESITDSLSGKRDNENLSNYPGGQSQIHSFYSELEIAPIESLSFNLGARFQDYSLKSNNPEHKAKKTTELSKKLSTSYSPLSWLTLNASYSEGFNAPKIQEVYVDGLHFPGDGFFIADNYFIPNYDLNHETSKTYEVGTQINTNLFNEEDLLTVSANLYWNDIQNYIYFEQIDQPAWGSDEVGTTQLKNMPLAETFGREFSISYLYDQLESSVSFTQSRGYNRLENNYIASMPADQYTFNLRYNLVDQGIVFGYLGIKALDQNRVNIDTTERADATPGYFVHNLHISKKFSTGLLKGFELATRIDNLTNRKYRKHFSNIMETGQDFKLSLKYSL